MDDVVVTALTKTYRVPSSTQDVNMPRRFWSRSRRIVAIDDISFAVPAVEILGLLGSNGAGKTTLVKCLSGIVTPDRGTIRVLGYDPHRQRHAYTSRIGLVMGQKSLLLWDVPVVESLKLYRDIYDVPEADFKRRLADYADLLEIGPLLHIPVRKLSLGQRMRAEFVAAMLHEPKVVFLDEPTIGLDVLAKERIRQFLYRLQQHQGTTIILTTHDMRDVEALATRVLLLDSGRIYYDGTVESLKRRQPIRVVHLTYEAVVNRVLFDQISNRWLVLENEPGNLRLRLSQSDVLQLTQIAMSALDLTDITIEPPSLDQIMQELLERGIADGGRQEMP